MALNNTPKPTGSVDNTSKPASYITWDTNTTTWNTEVRTWDQMVSPLNNTTRPTASLNNTPKPTP